ncbi:G-type lectin S-receptor-like serine/threonine-protein kinase LECRK1 [Ricinus communis]|uniref:G-type lectin S-receptor-like serine/threonine-protein kinase LECRK1 n=1 Tax=Ricinus communis TaxID=3988 RepID=UPI00201AFAF5|nr:G-type lectin S-receptor-like serine/threonine-protein kinase LECRK1 [Ricinus communis]
MRMPSLLRRQGSRLTVITCQNFAAMFLFLLFLSSIFSGATAQQRVSNISLGSALTPTSTSYWSSNSGHFAFGFYPEGNGFAVGIWFANIQQRTVIWTANRDDTPLPSDVTLTLSTDGRLILQFNQGQEIPISDATLYASSASMLDSGNFVLYDSESRIIWQTFDAPTDAIISGQRLLAGKQLVASISNTNHSSGRFELIMQTDGNLVLYPAQNPKAPNSAYWHTETFTAGNNVSLNLKSNGQLYLLNSTGFIIKTLKDAGTISGNPIYRATIDVDGIFRLYSHNLDQNSNWSIEWSSSDNLCNPIGLCGLNSYCTLAGGSPTCVCTPGFDFIDHSQKNLGCKKNSSSVDCTSLAESNFTMHELRDITWEDNPYSILSSSTRAACREECLGDCNCEAAIYNQNQECRKQKLPLRFGRTQKGQISTFIKISIGNSRTTGGSIERKNGQGKDVLIIGIVFLTLSIIMLAIFGILFFRYRIWNYKKISSHPNDELLEDVTLRSFTFDELKKATNNFKNEIGRGASGTVFKGVLSNSSRAVAIKRLEKMVAEGERGFQNEMKIIGRTHHKNLVRLFGYCQDGTNKLLVYEYMSSGSLADFLFKGEEKPAWEERIQIALNVARGIFYLHEECSTPIIHCDIKPENILMDEKEGAKIADFGLSKLLMPNQSKTYTGVRGTRGYVAPEWHTNLPITVKADVYSYGIMLLEIICCRENVDMSVPDDEIVLANWVYDCFEAKELDKLMQDEVVEEGKFERMVKVGLWCIQDEPSLRPSMKKVLLMLEGTIDIPTPPSPPAFSSSYDKRATTSLTVV